MLRTASSVLFSLLLATQLTQAQVTTATISGMVRDSTGAVIPEANVTLRNQDTGLTRTVTTDAQGRYQAPNLTLGNYEAQVQKEGFQTEVRRGIVLTIGREAVVNFELQVGSVTQTVEVTGEAPLVETTNASISALVETAQIQNLPLNGRSFDELALLQPGVVISRVRAGNFQGGYTVKLSIRGARPEQNSFLLDGTDVMGPTNQIPGSVGGQSLGVDTVREFRVEAGTFSAQYGRAAGGVINVVTKSGTNELHGTVFEFLRNDNLDARGYFDPEKPEFKRNQFGFSLGGPIRKDKLFFFGSFEALKDRLGQTLRATVPTAGAREGRIPNPTTGQVTQVNVNPAVKPYLDLYPLPNSQDFGDGTAEYIEGYSQPTDEDNITARVDYNPSESDSFFGRYTFDDGSRRNAGNWSLAIEDSRNRNQFLTLEETHIFSPTLLNTFRFGVNRTYQALLPEIALDDSVLAQLSFVTGQRLFKSGSSLDPGGGISSIGENNNPRIWGWNLFEWSDDLTSTRGAHTIKGGVLVKRIQFNQNEALNAGGVVRFGSLRAFLLATPRDIRVAKPGSATSSYWRYNYFGWHIQDDIRWTPRLTLNLGLRHEFYTGPREKFRNFCNLDDLHGDFRCGARIFPNSATVKDFGPRFGFAWDVFGDGRTSMRGGFGIYFDAMSPLWWQAGGSTQPPFNRVEIQNPPFPNVTDLLVSGSTRDVQLTPSPLGVTATPSTLQYSFTIQRQLAASTVVAVGYVGSQGRHLWTRGQENIVNPMILSDGRKFFPAPPPGTATQAIRRRTDLGNTRYIRTQSNSSYNGMIASLQNRFRGGLQFQVSYTLAKSLDTLANPNASQIMDPENWKLDRSLSDYDTRQSLSSNFTWELPFGPGRHLASQFSGVAAKLVEGWQLGGVLKIKSSSPVNIANNERAWSRNGSTGSSIQERPDLIAGKSNNPVLGSPDGWFDPSSFRIQDLGFYGNLARNSLSGPEEVNLDFSLVKNTGLPSISEQFRLQFRAEFFNVPNRGNFGSPSTLIWDADGRMLPLANIGRIRTTSTTSRQIQFGLKVSW